MDQELLGRVSLATQELLGQDTDLRALRTYETKNREELAGPRALRASENRAGELKGIYFGTNQRILRIPAHSCLLRATFVGHID
eukprot:COSAG02_NODE_1702_length_11245_cov_6.015432_3_plen_84_part_00